MNKNVYDVLNWREAVYSGYTRDNLFLEYSYLYDITEGVIPLHNYLMGVNLKIFGLKLYPVRGGWFIWNQCGSCGAKHDPEYIKDGYNILHLVCSKCGAPVE